MKNNFSCKESTKPRLLPPCRGWVEDLDSPKFALFASDVHDCLGINNVSEVYQEIRRPFAILRGLIGCMTIALSLMTLFLLYIADLFLIEGGLEGVLLFTISLVVGFWCTATGFRFVFSIPRDNPIRFNRARQKIYAYNTNPNWCLPWRACPVDIAIYDWSQVRAEYFFINMKNFSGEGIMLSIVKPGTHEVIDRFPLRFGAQDASLWNYICTYMQHGPCALPPFNTPRDANEVAPYSLFHRMAQQVKWPPDIDRESTSAP